jgi:hypothetical protein
MTLTAGTNYLYIAPGVYRESVTLTVTPTVTNTLVIAGDPTVSQFVGITANHVRVTGATSDSAQSSSSTRIDTNAKPYVTIQDLVIEGAYIGGASNPLLISGTNTTVDRVVVYGGVTGSLFVAAPNTSSNAITIRNSTFVGGQSGLRITTPTAASGVSGVVVQNCQIIAGYANGFGIAIYPTSGTTMPSVLVTNCFIQGFGSGIYLERGNTTNTHTVQNCIISGCSQGINSFASSVAVQQNNVINCTTSVTNVATSVTTVNSDFLGIDLTQNFLQKFGSIIPFGTLVNSRNTGFGTASNAPATDAYGVTWTGATPDVGAVTLRNITGLGLYNPTERNASAITIAPASTSQSIELYLGATGLAFNTSGLAAYYVRNQSAPVAITLVTQTPTGAWTSGGFAEISSSLVPGVYRLDVPNAAFAAGASDVTIVVRGASGTNGAVLTVTLSSGGLTAAQTAAAVWDEPYTSHTTASTFGARTLKTTVDNRPADVGTSFHIQANVHAIVDSTAAASELSGALLHNGTDYISADLLTPVSAATSVHIGPYQLLADGLGADQPLDVNVGTATSIDVQVTDANGTGIDITGATVTAKVYSSAGTLVATYSGTATYADNGRLSFGLTTTVTNTSGTYTVTVTRTTGATNTQIFGPLRLYVRPV